MKQHDRKWEKGAVTIIEATFVFPITFFIVFFMIMAGEGYYQHARVENLVTYTAITGASRCENPMLSQFDGNSVPTDPTETDIMPYRYIFTGEAQRIAGGLQGQLEEQVSSLQPLLFKGMAPQNVSVKVDPQLNLLISSCPVSCYFEIPFPIKMIFTDMQLSFRYNVQMTASVGDPAEFVRNVGMISDLIERSQFADFLGNVKAKIDEVGGYLN